ncbi:hypothetical protein K439DRAFT_1643370, partial [Ramaria rubella]
MPSSSPSDTYPCWLPKWIPPPVPAIDILHHTCHQCVPRGHRPTPSSVCIVAHESPTSDSARMQPPLQPALHPVPTHAPRSFTIWPRFHAL